MTDFEGEAYELVLESALLRLNELGGPGEIKHRFNYDKTSDQLTVEIANRIFDLPDVLEDIKWFKYETLLAEIQDTGMLVTLGKPQQVVLTLTYRYRQIQELSRRKISRLPDNFFTLNADIRSFKTIAVKEAEEIFYKQMTEFLSFRFKYLYDFEIKKSRNPRKDPFTETKDDGDDIIYSGYSGIMDPLIPVTVKCHQSGLNIVYSPIYARRTNNYFGGPSTPVRSGIRAGIYNFGGQQPSGDIHWDNLNYQIPNVVIVNINTF
jgi:hypothetical protein